MGGSTPGQRRAADALGRVKAALYPDTADLEDFSHERVARLLRLVDGQPASSFSGKEGVVEEAAW